jgi:hypothetical protein
LVLLDERVTLSPPFGAEPFTVTVPVAEFPPVTELGDTVTPVNAAGLTVNDAVLVTEP